MDTALYYTFSTISQTLGGAIALLAAFILYRMQLIKSEMEDHYKTLFSLVKKSSTISNEQELEMKKFYQEENFVGISKLLGGISFPQVNENDRTRGKEHASEMGKIIIHKNSIMKQFNFSLVLTLILIFISVVFIVLTPLAVNYLFFVILFFGVGTVLFGYCLKGYYQLIHGALNIKRN